LREAERLDKETKVNKQHELKRIFDENADRARKNSEARISKNKNQPDYENYNVFTYIFEPKIHKSHSMGKRNEHLISLMKDQFITKPRVVNDEDLLKQVKEQNEKSENERIQREKQRKVKEMEAKFF
jgi:hypothetical protein